MEVSWDLPIVIRADYLDNHPDPISKANMALLTKLTSSLASAITALFLSYPHIAKMKRSEENKACRLTLRKIERSIIAQCTAHPDLNALAEVSIAVRIISTFEPRFFQLYPDAQLGGPDSDRV
jgi:hypothetical protein